MFSDSEHDIADLWKTYANFTIRPVPSTINYYQRIIRKYASLTQYFLYGSTPEIRSIFQMHNQPLAMMDQSLTMIKAMGRLTFSGEPVAYNESVRLGNWLDSDDQRYDLLLGDDAINMVSWSQFELFLERAYQRLNRGGIFICHLLIQPDEIFIKQSLEEVVNDYHCGLITNNYDLASRVNFICYDRDHYRMGWQNTIHQLGRDQLSLLIPDLDFINQFKDCNSVFVCPPQACFEDLVSQYFNIVEIFYPHEFDYCQYEPVYILQKKDYV
jgi:hypothetical protein